MIAVQLKDVGRLIIPDEIESVLRGYYQRRWQKERGGVLAGSLKEDGSWVLTHVMPPSPKNRAGRYWHERNREAAQEYLDLLFAETQGTVVYLGDWHTHPERSVEPSGPDTRMLADILTTGNIPTGFAIGIIVDSKKSLLIWRQILNDINHTNPEIFIL